MGVRKKDICIVRGFRLTEYQVCNGDNIAYSYFNIRNDRGTMLGRNYDDIERPLDIMISMWADEDTSLISA